MTKITLTNDVQRRLSALPMPARAIMRLRLGYHLNMLRWLDRRYESMIAYRGFDFDPPAGHPARVHGPELQLDRDDDVALLRKKITLRRVAISQLVTLLHRKTGGPLPASIFATWEERNDG